MSENIVLTSVNERGIAEVILNRPERNNAYNGDMIIELIKSFESLYKNNSVRIVLIKGNGKHFQAHPFYKLGELNPFPWPDWH